MDGRNFLGVAKILISGNSEAEYRSAVSRAYYGAYIFAWQLLQGWGFPTERGPGGHGKAKDRFLNCGIEDIKGVASNLADLYSRRIDADYLRDNRIGKKKTAELYVDIAENIIRIFEEHSVEPCKTKMISGIKSYDLKIKGHSN